MRKIVECVPNFSEGNNRETIDAIARAIEDTPGCTLLDVDPGKSTNRTVYTFVGDPDAVVQGALNSARIAKEKIDMRIHKGEHPRMGAMDVCPFIPVANVSMDECVEISNTFGRLAAEALDVPIFLYEAAAVQDYRRKLPQVRQGEYEGLAARLADERWKPDFGPTKFDPRWGATATGARSFLIAYNVNILGTSNQAHRIALNLREAGRGPDEPGRLKEVKGMGWFVDEYNMAHSHLVRGSQNRSRRPECRGRRFRGGGPGSPGVDSDGSRILHGKRGSVHPRRRPESPTGDRTIGTQQRSTVRSQREDH